MKRGTFFNWLEFGFLIFISNLFIWKRVTIMNLPNCMSRQTVWLKRWLTPNVVLHAALARLCHFSCGISQFDYITQIFAISLIASYFNNATLVMLVTQYILVASVAIDNSLAHHLLWVIISLLLSIQPFIYFSLYLQSICQFHYSISNTVVYFYLQPTNSIEYKFCVWAKPQSNTHLW